LKQRGVEDYNSGEKAGNKAYLTGQDRPKKSYTYDQDRMEKYRIYKELLESDDEFMNFYNETLKKIDAELPKYQKGSKMQSLPLKGNQYKTLLTSSEEDEFQKWYAKVSKYKSLNPNPDDPNHYYDIRGYWKNEDRE
jgi:hypothetical protein